MGIAGGCLAWKARSCPSAIPPPRGRPRQTAPAPHFEIPFLNGEHLTETH